MDQHDKMTFYHTEEKKDHTSIPSIDLDIYFGSLGYNSRSARTTNFLLNLILMISMYVNSFDHKHLLMEHLLRKDDIEYVYGFLIGTATKV